MSNKKQFVLALGIMTLGVVARLFLQDYANVEPITLLAILAGAYIGRTSYALIIPLGIVAISDMIIGNTSILLFTWSAWAGIGAASIILRKLVSKNTFPIAATGVAIASTVFFYLWTNFGVWLTTTMYAKTAAGLLQSYIMAIPFLRTQLVSNILLVSIATTGIMLVRYIIKHGIAQKMKIASKG